MEKRGKKRVLKRLSVRFGTQKPDHTAFTHDLSSTGIFLKTTTVFSPNTRLQIELTLPDDKVIHVRGIVMWAKRIPPAFNRVIQKHGMGIHLLDIPDEYKRLIERLHL
ncbi:PilZ domain-containing protein [Candidatus Manganitrophus noduliformans]|uniref:Pilus assembly protein PilZ n=1 Tax=Candidatus Manganitrophus noduliformans TaxID=2606439 RepID=A0A7X6DNE1_9BACT|nr:PilZ domain-containing protein [Candidatus Manganitrophus noduliformans]NKE70438.1 pilus assembly protein PilZ [Candidatus Manganitrophus noduliformans]